MFLLLNIWGKYVSSKNIFCKQASIKLCCSHGGGGGVQWVAQIFSGLCLHNRNSGERAELGEESLQMQSPENWRESTGCWCSAGVGNIFRVERDNLKIIYIFHPQTLQG